ncbi:MULTISPECIES: hypothetical protein [unclassified Streptomyces]|uniref:hypothetical protein n=1 Tax=unclassified Streptomyces TaxID=2593676 RepID=UPI0001C1A35B|nr:MULTISPECIES: hypothetical protein [unclassified Streptomyces]AEN10233.1 conserved hypothetical protein [Streptomyces sp. SirexAA-E]MYR66915.1 hypothetical protein [Streptomyces sp. SID4939]MYR98896.1 hypothetical protein [Streptomyces sp. SID4940]MYT65384.1 hypothetical protein [Streptomyces sp. SID8357]MYT84439.1 hypothetical protein [Streptomyces sp. SID8360]
MKGWDTEGQRWEPSPAPDTGLPRALEQGLRIAAVALAVAVLGTVAFGGGRLIFREDEAQGVEASAEAIPGETDTAGTAAGAGGTEEGDTGLGTPSPDGESPTAEEPPPGFVWQEDPQGFSVQVREEWQRREDPREAGVVVFYETDDGDGMLQIYRISEPGYTPYDALEETDRLVGRAGGYERVRLDELDATDGSETAELEYRVPREDGTVRRSLLRAFVAEDGVRWVVLVAGPDDEWDATYAESASVAAESFCPQGYCPYVP